MDKTTQKCQIFLLASLVLCCCPVASTYSQEIVLVNASNSSLFFTERSNWSTYRGGKYIGLTHREVRARLNAVEQTPSGREFNGYYYKLQQTNRDTVNVAQPIDSTIESRFTVSQTGSLSFLVDGGYPEYRNFPAFPQQAVTPGTSWVAEGSRCIDPLNDGSITELPILVQYTLVGEKEIDGEEVWVLTAKYATRYKLAATTTRRDPNLAEATGSHDISITVRKLDGSIRLITDRLDETFTYAGGDTIRFKGNTAIFSNIVYPTASLASNLESASRKPSAAGDKTGATPAEGIKAPDSLIVEGRGPQSILAEKQPESSRWVTETTLRGVRLSVRDLHFIANSAELLPGEADRLDAMAEVLSGLEGGQFLVEGHTAATGNPTGELELSRLRAMRIIDELCERGLSPAQFIYRGLGGTVPIGDNATDTGRAMNRRVEITVLN